MLTECCDCLRCIANSSHHCSSKMHLLSSEVILKKFSQLALSIISMLKFRLCVLTAHFEMYVFLYCCISQNFQFKLNPSSYSFGRRQWHPTPVLLHGKSHGRRSLVGCSPWGREELDMTERFHFHFSLSRIGGRNGNPLQCSCLEKPRNGGAWWAAIYGVTQSRTRLKQLSSSSSRQYKG